MIIGHYSHRYRVIEGWGDLDPGVYPVNDCHEMVVDCGERIWLATNECRNNILVYEKSGQIRGNWGHEYPGLHGLTLHEEDGREVLFLTDYERHEVIKTDLEGKVLLKIGYPVETGRYRSAAEFMPTETAIGPTGDIYVTDGYGLQFVIQYDRFGHYIRHWGGRGNGNDQFDCVHGIAVDNRIPGDPTLLITSRNHNAFKRFTLEGRYLDTIHLPGSFVCRPVIHGEYIYAAVFRSGSNRLEASGYLTILDRYDRVISSPGGTPPVYRNGRLEPQHQDVPVFIHPHDVCVDKEGNLYVCQWKAGKSYPLKLERV